MWYWDTSKDSEKKKQMSSLNRAFAAGKYMLVHCISEQYEGEQTNCYLTPVMGSKSILQRKIYNSKMGSKISKRGSNVLFLRKPITLANFHLNCIEASPLATAAVNSMMAILLISVKKTISFSFRIF